ncbi:MAG: DUF3040 domain-containing protein [Varibaculum sp.]|nr:DUF3040 domain-containing protein [Varibaculum sp.]
MGLSEYERQVLADLERDLGGSADATETLFVDSARPQNIVTPRAWALAVVLVLCGLVALLAAVSIGHLYGVILGVIGFTLALAGVMVPFNARVRLSGARKSANQAPKPDFWTRQERVWDSHHQ